MNNKMMYPFVVAGLLAAAGCSSTPSIISISGMPGIPGATTVDQTPQIKLQSAQHWGVIADHLASQIITSSRLESDAIYMDENPTASTFEKVFTQQMFSALVNRGARVMTAGSARLSMELDVEVVKHSNDRDRGSNFAATAAAGSLWAIAEFGPDISRGSSERIGYTVVPLAVARDVSKMFPSETSTEVVITTRIMDGGWISFSQTHSYYIPDMAAWQYRESRESAIVNMTRNDAPGGQ